eukprot:1150515-Pelagomonas_calceolata.AAC.3
MSILPILAPRRMSSHPTEKAETFTAERLRHSDWHLLVATLDYMNNAAHSGRTLICMPWERAYAGAYALPCTAPAASGAGACHPGPCLAAAAAVLCWGGCGCTGEHDDLAGPAAPAGGRGALVCFDLLLLYGHVARRKRKNTDALVQAVALQDLRFQQVGVPLSFRWVVLCWKEALDLFRRRATVLVGVRHREVCGEGLAC